MISKHLGLVVASLLLGCAAPAPPPPPPPDPPEPNCEPEGVFAKLPAEQADAESDALLAKGDSDSADSLYDVDDPKAAAKHSYEVGRKADRQKRWDDAYLAFRESWRLRKSPYFAFALAKVCGHMGRHREALYYIDFVLASSSVKDTLHPTALEWQKEANQHVTDLKINVEDGACVRLDGLIVGRAPLSAAVLVDAGDHHVEAFHAKKRASEHVSPAVGGTTDVTLSLK